MEHKRRSCQAVALLIGLLGLIATALLPTVATAAVAVEHASLRRHAPSRSAGSATPLGPNPNPPPGFQAVPTLSGLQQPVAVRFATDGRIFVAEKAGVLKVFHGLADAHPVTAIDFSTEVYSFLDHGFLGLELDPQFPSRPYVYALFTRDSFTRGGAVPAWFDGCAVVTGCTTYSRLVRFTMSGDVVASTTTLIDDWCEQSASHGIGAIVFGADGMLYTGGGDGANYTTTDWGQLGSPANPCGDPPGGVGSVLTPPTAEGGALRAQDIRTPADPTGLSGALIRVDPATGLAASGNPFIGSTDLNARRIVAYGIRNPYRVAVRPGTNEMYIGDVGWNYADEIDVIDNGATSTGPNFGWPCFEGSQVLPSWQSAGLNLCTSLYAATGSNAAVNPVFEYLHTGTVVPGEACPSGASALSGLAFYTGGSYPASYNGGLFFSDYTRQCIWFAPASSNGKPDFANRQTFMVTNGHYPVDLQVGVGGDLFYPDVVTGELMRIVYAPSNQTPTAAFTATPSSSAGTLTTTLDGSASSDPDIGETGQLQYAWELNADGLFDDATGASIAATFSTAGPHDVALRVTDPHGASATVHHSVFVGAPPVITMYTSPLTTAGWRVADTVLFSAVATDAVDGVLASSQFTWDVVLQHCDTANHCHAHPMQTFAGVDYGSFVAPDHAYPAHLVLTLHVVNSLGITASSVVQLDPLTTTIQTQSAPSGLPTTIDGIPTSSPTTVIVGSQHVVGTGASAAAYGAAWTFSSWSDGGPQFHTITASATPVTFVVNFTTPRVPQYRIAELDGTTSSFGIGVAQRTSNAVHALRGWVTGGASTPDRKGYWRVSATGDVYTTGTARFYGDTRRVHLNQPIVGMASTPTGRGYWLVASDGGIFSFGDARFHGSTGAIHLTRPIVGIATSRTGRGYWLVASDGGIFSFGDARFRGSLGGRRLAAPIVATTPTPSGRGYWMLSSRGDIYTFGDARRYGSSIVARNAARTIGMLVTPDGNGYWVLDDHGVVRAYGDAPNFGSFPTLHRRGTAHTLL